MKTMQQTDNLQPGKIQIASSSKYSTYQQILLALLCLILAIAAYKCVVLKAFLGDDHVHLIWLKEAMQHPEMILRNFYSNWMYAETTPKCYRPMISVFMFTDYLLWHRNAIGFHLTNLFFLGLSSIALYGCVSEISRWAPSTSRRLWPVLASGAFVLYPSHPEAISWVTGRVDAVVTAFYLCSIYAYMVWRRTDDKRFGAGAMISMLLSLASKEMAVTIPLVFTFFELLRPQAGQTVGTKVGAAVKFTAVGWIILGGYFILRRFALGTFVGGYDNSLEADWHVLSEHWFFGLNKFFVPFNDYYLKGNELILTLWCGLTAALYLVTSGFLLSKQSRNQVAFFLGMAVISFIPVYKLFNGMPDLQGSRFSYLGSAPICALLAFGLASIPALCGAARAKFGNILQLTTALTFFSLSAYMLWINNQPWSVASHWVANMEKGFDQTMANASQLDHYVYFNIPNNYRGAYLARNATADIGQHQNIDWSPVETDDKLRETGLLRECIGSGARHYKSFYWNEQSAAFVPLTLPPNDIAPTAVSAWNSSKLTERLAIMSGQERVQQPLGSTLKISAGAQPLMLMLKINSLPLWKVDFIRLQISRNKSVPVAEDKQLSIMAATDLMQPRIFTATVLNKSAESDKQTERSDLLFGLRLIPPWFCASRSGSCVIVVPPQWSGSMSVDVPRKQNLMPQVQRKSTDKYVMEQTPIDFSVDVTQIEGASGVLVQISRKNSFFARQNTADFENDLTAKTSRIGSKNASVTLKHSDFPEAGGYQLRCWALDKAGNRVGLSSDYLFANVQ